MSGPYRPVCHLMFGTERNCLWLLGLLFIGATQTRIGVARADTITNVTNIQAGGYGGLYVGNRAPLQPSPLLRLPPGSIQPQGWLLTMLQNQSNGLNGLQQEVSPFLEFSTSDWATPNGSGTTQGWERVPYWLRGYINLGYCLPEHRDHQQRKQVDPRGDEPPRERTAISARHKITRTGEPNDDSDLGSAPDLWPNMPMLDALRSYYEIHRCHECPDADA